MNGAPFDIGVLDSKIANSFSSGWRMWLNNAIAILTGVQYQALYTLAVPLTGFSIQAASNSSKLVLAPAGVLATGAVQLPANPYDGFEWRLSSSTAITALTLTAAPNTGHTVMNAPAALAAGVGIGYTYASSTKTWYRLY
jgi:hypothetical protein